MSGKKRSTRRRRRRRRRRHRLQRLVENGSVVSIEIKLAQHDLYDVLYVMRVRRDSRRWGRERRREQDRLCERERDGKSNTGKNKGGGSRKPWDGRRGWCRCSSARGWRRRRKFSASHSSTETLASRSNPSSDQKKQTELRYRVLTSTPSAAAFAAAVVVAVAWSIPSPTETRPPFFLTEGCEVRKLLNVFRRCDRQQKGFKRLFRTFFKDAITGFSH